MFGYAFNNPKYSDRMLHLVFSSGDDEEEEEEEELLPDEKIGEPATPKQKREGNSEISINQETDFFYVSSVVIAKDSSFFRAMFDRHGFEDSSNRVIEILLNHQDREAFLDLLKYLYTMELQASTCQELLLTWQLSERFLVDSCADLCVQRLLPLPFSWRDSISILEQIIVVKKTEQTESLAEKSILALANHFGRKNVENKLQYKTELQQISSQVIELFLSFDSLPFDDEKEVYQLLDDWIHAKYENAESVEDEWLKLQHVVRWPFMDIGHLKTMIRQPEWKRRPKDLMMEALLYHVSTEEEKAIIASDSLHGNMYQRRVNSRILIKSLSGNKFTDQETIFFSITLDIRERMQKQELETQPFYLRGTKFVWKFMPCDEGPPKMWLQQYSKHPTMIVDVYFWIWNGAPQNSYGKEFDEKNKVVGNLGKYNFIDTYFGNDGVAWCKLEIHGRMFAGALSRCS